MSEVKPSSNYYELLGVGSGASVQDIRRAYRELSKLYHPDTTELPAADATEKFQELNDAYATLSSPDRRASYDLRNGYSRVRVIRPDLPLNQNGNATQRHRSSAYLDPSDRPLSPGEIFALFVLGLTFLGCLLLVVTLSFTRGDLAIRSLQQVPVPDAVRQVLQGDNLPPLLPPIIAPPPSVDPAPEAPETLPPVGSVNTDTSPPASGDNPSQGSTLEAVTPAPSTLFPQPSPLLQQVPDGTSSSRNPDL